MTAGRRVWHFVYFVVLGLGTKEDREEYRARSRWTTPPKADDQAPTEEADALAAPADVTSPEPVTPGDDIDEH